MNQSTNKPLSLDRRKFLASALAAGAIPLIARADAAPAKKFTGAIIGHSGRGDYGHGIDLIFSDRDDVELLAVADASAEGRAKTAQKIRAPRQYEDYREMLAKERPQLVGIGPRWTDQRREMALAAIAAGAHLYTEKPFATDLAECDEILAAADKAGRKIAVAHQTRLAPGILHLKKMIEQGLIGELLEVDAWGKQDQRAGGEDMLVLGTHVFDLLRFFAGSPSWCTARVTQKGRDITAADGRKAGEEIGLVAGNEISAQFAFQNSVQGTFTSRGKMREAVGHWGFFLVGTKGTARVLMDIWPNIFVTKAAPWSREGKTESWQRVSGDPGLSLPESERSSTAANRRVVDDWLDAIRTDREPMCSGKAATAAIEMVMAVYQAAIAGKRVEFPLKERKHPLGGPR